MFHPVTRRTSRFQSGLGVCRFGDRLWPAIRPAAAVDTWRTPATVEAPWRPVAFYVSRGTERGLDTHFPHRRHCGPCGNSCPPSPARGRMDPGRQGRIGSQHVDVAAKHRPYGAGLRSSSYLSAVPGVYRRGFARAGRRRTMCRSRRDRRDRLGLRRRSPGAH